MAEYFYITVQKINHSNVRVRFDCFDKKSKLYNGNNYLFPLYKKQCLYL